MAKRTSARDAGRKLEAPQQAAKPVAVSKRAAGKKPSKSMAAFTLIRADGTRREVDLDEVRALLDTEPTDSEADPR